jgi:hypothetical protein
MDKRSLSSSDRWLIEKCQEVNFGRVEFEVSGGAADPPRPHRLVRTLRLLGGVNGPRPEASRPIVQLGGAHAALLQSLRGLADGSRVVVRVMHGLPTSAIDVEEPTLAV